MMTAYPIFYLMNHTDNRLALSSAALRRVDDFTMSITPPKAGIISLTIHIDGCGPSTFVLRAENDDLMKLKTWMEDVVREEHAEVELSGGQCLAYSVTDVPESSVEPTIRFLDELFPSPIGILTLTPAEGQAIECVVKVKHFLNALYLYLLTESNPYLKATDYESLVEKEWYAYTTTEKMMDSHSEKELYHYNKLHSLLLEWYLCASASYTDFQPQFVSAEPISNIVKMWVDWSSVFWDDYVSIGGSEEIHIGHSEIDLSDIKELLAWEMEYYDMSEACYGDTVTETYGTAAPTEQECNEWHIRGYHVAHQVKIRLPRNAALLYKMTPPMKIMTEGGMRDVGHIIFDPRLLEKQTDERKG